MKDNNYQFWNMYFMPVTSCTPVYIGIYN